MPAIETSDVHIVKRDQYSLDVEAGWYKPARINHQFNACVTLFGQALNQCDARHILAIHERNWHFILISNERQLVIPAQAGIQSGRPEISWIPACAGMTSRMERSLLVWLTFIANQVIHRLVVLTAK